MNEPVELTELRRTGDYLQSEASRLAEWVREQHLQLPYEVLGALIGTDSAIREWTEIRAHSRVDGQPLTLAEFQAQFGHLPQDGEG